MKDQMPSGSKKKGGFRKNTSTSKQGHNAVEDSPLPDENLESNPKVEENVYNNENRKYQRRKVNSNLDRYEEPVIDIHADDPQGNDYEVLRSYSGGAGSQYRFLDEREWESNTDDVQNLTLDLNDLSQSLKQIPFYERLHLPEDIFEPKQIQRMNMVLNESKPSLSMLKNKKMDIFPKAVPEEIIPDLDLSTPSDGFAFRVAQSEPVNTFIDNKSVIPEDARDAIESIAARLASGPSLPPRIQKPFNDEPVDDELSKLLSLSNPNRLNEPKPSIISDADIDDFLNSILDD